MSTRFRIDGDEYDSATLSENGRVLYERLIFTQRRLQELGNQQALLSKAKNAYIADLKTEIVRGKTGIDLSDLFSDD